MEPKGLGELAAKRALHRRPHALALTVVDCDVEAQGRLSQLRAELGLDSAKIGELFDLAYPVKEKVGLTPVAPRFSTGSLALMVGLGGMALLAVVLAFTRGVV